MPANLSPSSDVNKPGRDGCARLRSRWRESESPTNCGGAKFCAFTGLNAHAYDGYHVSGTFPFCVCACFYGKLDILTHRVSVHVKTRGIDFAAVHDSFWTHAGDVDEMNHILRQEFVNLHSQDILEDIYTQFQRRYPQNEIPRPVGCVSSPSSLIASN